MKRCGTCNQDLPPEMFGPKRGTCTACRRAQGRAYASTPEAREKRRLRSRDLYAKARAVITEMKSRPCMDCGVQYPAYVMQFDHRDPSTKQADVGTLCGSGYLAGILREAAKCDIVCSNCHKMRTHRQQQAGIAAPLGRPIES